MTAALITATTLSIASLVATFVLGFTAGSREELLQHTTFGIFTTLILLLSHSFTMFYLIGKGKAIREAVTEGGLSSDLTAQVLRMRRPVFSAATLAMTLTMAAAIMGGGVDTGALPAIVHSSLAVAALLSNFAALRAEIRALVSCVRVAGEVDRLLET